MNAAQAQEFQIMQLTNEQSAITDFVRRGQGHLLIEALAGSGKTFTLIEALKVIPQRSILVCAFNKRIATEIQSKIPRLPKAVIHVKTFHALGWSILRHYHPKLVVDENNGASERLIGRACERHNATLSYQARRAAIKLLRTWKDVEPIELGTLGVSPLGVEPEDLMDVGHEYDLFGKLTDPAIIQLVGVVATAIDFSVQIDTIETIDFCDMVWLPLVLSLQPPSRYQAILVDEWQDLSRPQFELVRRMRAPGPGRLIMAGDQMQAVYSWRGGEGEHVKKTMIEDLKALTLPLTTSFRCSRAVIKEAQALVPAIQAWDQAVDGSVLNVGLRDLPRMIMGGHSDEIHTFVLSRTNADLLDAALYLWREGVRFQLNAGKQMLDPLFDLLDRLDLRSRDQFRKSLGSWYGTESARAEASDQTAWRERLDEQYSMLIAVVGYVEPSGIQRLLKSILVDGKTGVLLSTVHKVKGLEADRVFLLKQTFGRHKSWVEDQLFGALDQEEANIEYVAITRSKDHLIWVDIEQKTHTQENSRWYLFENTQGETQATSSKPLAAMKLEDIESLWAELEAEGIRLDRLGRSAESIAIVKYAIALKAHYDDLLARG